MSKEPMSKPLAIVMLIAVIGIIVLAVAAWILSSLPSS